MEKNKNKIIVLVSGNGTNLQAIIDNCNNGTLNASVSLVISNNKSALALQRATSANIPTYVCEFNSKEESRDNYNQKLASIINKYEYDLIVLAGWMHILTNAMITNVRKPIMNLHPALPNQFPGNDAIVQAFTAFKNGLIKNTGVMVHKVTPIVDVGTIYETKEVPIWNTDTIETLTNRVQYFEKFVLISAIQKFFIDMGPENTENYPMIYKGKVRDVYDIGYNMLAFRQTDRQSAFDRHICEIPNRGNILTATSAWWFEKTKHIIPNHYLYHNKDIMICKRTIPYKIEVVVRGYITGNSKTSLWTYYERGERTYCGISFPDGLVKNQKLDMNVVTPTTKGDTDEPISAVEIVEQGFMTQKEWEYIEKKALEIFAFSQWIAERKGLILVDTKYEFGLDPVNNEILLIDEINTHDSSRFWLSCDYHDRMEHGLEPEKLDKDVVRTWLAKNCDPYNDEIPTIPSELINNARHAYETFYAMLTGFTCEPNIESTDLKHTVENYMDYHNRDMVVIVSGSEKDKNWFDRIQKELANVGIYSKIYVASAHKNTQAVLSLLHHYNKQRGKRRIVFVAVAGMSNALGGVLSANTQYPVINCPPYSDKTDMLTNIHSSVQNPSNVPATLILNPINVALFCKNMFGMV